MKLASQLQIVISNQSGVRLYTAVGSLLIHGTERLSEIISTKLDPVDDHKNGPELIHVDFN